LLVPSEGRLASRSPPPTASPPNTALGRHWRARHARRQRPVGRTGPAGQRRECVDHRAVRHRRTRRRPRCRPRPHRRQHRNHRRGTRWAGSSPSPASPATPSESGGSSSSRAASCSASRAPAASTIDDVLHTVLGPALGRLRRTFTKRASYAAPHSALWPPRCRGRRSRDVQPRRAAGNTDKGAVSCVARMPHDPILRGH